MIIYIFIKIIDKQLWKLEAYSISFFTLSAFLCFPMTSVGSIPLRERREVFLLHLIYYKYKSFWDRREVRSHLPWDWAREKPPQRGLAIWGREQLLKLPLFILVKSGSEINVFVMTDLRESTQWFLPHA